MIDGYPPDLRLVVCEYMPHGFFGLQSSDGSWVICNILTGDTIYLPPITFNLDYKENTTWTDQC